MRPQSATVKQNELGGARRFPLFWTGQLLHGVSPSGSTIILDLRASYRLMLRTDKRDFVQLVGCGALLGKMLTRIDT
jgi:hypothetical protein